MTDETVREADYISMIDENGVPQTIDMATVRQKLGSIAKQKAPGLTGNGPDLCAAQPGSWVEWAVVLFNVIHHTQITPRGWHVDLVHYVHQRRQPQQPSASGADRGAQEGVHRHRRRPHAP